MRFCPLLLATALLATALLGSACAPDAASTSEAAPSFTVRSVPGDVERDTVRLPQADTARADAATGAPSATPDDPSDDDAPAINAALRRAAPGEVVLLGVGTYHLRGEIAMRPGVTLRGQGAATVLSDQRGGTEKVVMFYEDDGAGLEALTVRSDAPTAMDDLVVVMNSRAVVLDGLVLRRFARNAVYVAGSADVRVTGLDVADATHLDGGEGYGVHLTKRTRATTVTDSRFGPPLRHAIVIQRESHGNRVEGNVIAQPTKDGIDLHGSGEYDNRIVGNTVSGSGSAGIGVGETGRAAGRGNVLEDNTLRGNKWGVILHGESAGTIVRGNHISASGDHGIYAKEAPETVIVGNTITDTRSYWGIRVLEGAGTRIEGNRLRGNAKPIDAGDSPDVVIRDNIIE